jgi:hypothetical protein
MGFATVRARWLDSAPPTLLERGSRHCHGINCAQTPSMSVIAILRHLATARHLRAAEVGRNLSVCQAQPFDTGTLIPLSVDSLSV